MFKLSWKKMFQQKKNVWTKYEISCIIDYFNSAGTRELTIWQNIQLTRVELHEKLAKLQNSTAAKTSFEQPLRI